MNSIFNKVPIDIAMTSVVRPSILEGTLKTIVKFVVDDISRFRLILNIDPIGEDKNPCKMVKVARKYFPNILFNIAHEPSFPKAVKWVWSRVESPYFFHWEDDVDILRSIDVNKMIDILDRYPKLSSLRLYKGSTPRNKTSMYTFQCIWIYNKEGFYVAKDWKNQFGLNPVLVKREFITKALPKLREKKNPEKQFRYSQKYMREVIREWEYGIYANPGEKRLIDGRKGQEWKNMMGLQKPKGQEFLEWVK